MKIGNLSESTQALPIKPGKPDANPVSVLAASVNSPVASVDKVALSATTQKLASDIATQKPSSFDSARVQALREAIANGTYKIDSMAIAEKLINEQIDFMGANPRN